MLVEGLGRGLIGLIYVFKGLLGLSVENRSPGRQARGQTGAVAVIHCQVVVLGRSGSSRRGEIQSELMF